MDKELSDSKQIMPQKQQKIDEAKFSDQNQTNDQKKQKIISLDDVLKLGADKQESKLSIKDLVDKELNQVMYSIQSQKEELQIENSKRKIHGKFRQIFQGKQKKLFHNQQPIKINIKDYQFEQINDSSTDKFSDILDQNQSQYINSKGDHQLQNKNLENNQQIQQNQNSENLLSDLFKPNQTIFNMKQINNISDRHISNSNNSEEEKVCFSKFKDINEKDQKEEKDNLNIGKKRKFSIRFSGQSKNNDDDMQILETSHDQNNQQQIQNIEDDSQSECFQIQEPQKNKKLVSVQNFQSTKVGNTYQKNSSKDIINIELNQQNNIIQTIGINNQRQTTICKQYQDSGNQNNLIPISEKNPKKISQHSKVMLMNSSRGLRSFREGDIQKNKNLKIKQEQNQQKNKQSNSKEISDTQQQSKDNLCPICYENPKNNHKSNICQHKACYDCWKKWLLEQLTCPMCRVRCRLAYLESCE